jgi:peptidoglycan-associated lipoprotein
VEVALARDPGFFSYLDDYRFKLRGRLDLAAPSAAVTALKVSVARAPGLFVPWERRYRLELAATSYPSERPGEAQAAATKPEPVVAPTPSALAASTSPAKVAEVAEVARTAPKAAAPPDCALEPVTFAYGRATLGRKAKGALDRFAACLGGAVRAVRLEGHCDEHGGEEFNLRLGQRRAEAAARHLKARGKGSLEVTTGSRGKSRPLCSDDTRACDARNRRAEAILDGS